MPMASQETWSRFSVPFVTFRLSRDLKLSRGTRCGARCAIRATSIRLHSPQCRVIIDALGTRPRSATPSYFQLPVCIELARVAHRFEVPDDLQESYFAAISRLPALVAEASVATWDADMTAVAAAAIAVAKGQWNIAELLINIEPGDYAEVLSWYHSR